MAPFNSAWFKRLRSHIESGARGTTASTTTARARHRLGLLFLMLPVSAFAIAQSLRFDIAEQPMPTALKAFADQAKIQLLYRHDAVKGATGNTVVGEFDTRDALQMLLRGTGLEVVYSKDNAATIRPMQTASKPTAAVPRTNQYTRLAQAETGSSQASSSEVSAETSETSSQRRIELEEIIVTGTNIRGVYPSSSPVEIYTAEDIAHTGATTTEQFVQKLPQNLGTRTQFASLAVADGSIANPESVNSIDLRGLGVSTTLTLLNGRRLALASVGQAVDVSLIPVSAIDRVEVLTDGASAIYGADAVGGVVNFVLRDDFEGAETRLSYGGVTSGGMRQGNFTQTFGDNWTTGHGLVSFDAFSASALQTTERDYATAAGDRNLTPTDQRYSALATITQDFGDRLTLNGDFAFSRRDIENEGTTPPGAPFIQTFLAQSQTEQYFANAGIDYEIAEDLNASFLISQSQVNVDSAVVQDFPEFGIVLDTSFDSEYTATDATVMSDGVAFPLPAGQVRFSLGAGVMIEEFRADRGAIGLSSQDLGRSTTYVFGEVLVPLIAEEQNFPFVRRLELSLAARYTSFEDDSSPPLANEFPSDTSPKVGLLWTPIKGINLRGTYGESFRAPSLTQLDQTRSLNLLQEGFYPIGTVLFAAGPSPQMRPETAESYTLGFDFRPTSRPTFALSGTYFNIGYVDRIQDGTAAANIAPFDQANYPDYVFRPTSAAQIEEFLRTTTNVFNNTAVSLADPASAATALFVLPDFFIVDGRIRNLALSEVDGFDITISDNWEMQWGEFSGGASVTRILSYRDQSSASAPVVSVVDTVTRPVDLRARAYVGFSNGGFGTTLSLSYVDDYANPLAASGEQQVESWTTFDWNARYDFAQSDTFLGGLSVRLSVQNVFDEDPPFVEASGGSTGIVAAVGFDPTNASPLGRLIVAELVKRW